MPTKTVLFIHGLFMTYHCWDQWVERYQAKGYTCVAVPYPQRDKSPAEIQKAHPDPNLPKVTFEGVLDHLIKTIQGLTEPPIIIGHSFGGLFTQLLINRGFGMAGVAVDSAPPQGLLSTKFSFLWGNRGLLNPLNRSSRPYRMSFGAFQYAFVNGMPEAEQRKIYEEQAVPESLRIPRGALSSPNARIDYRKPHPPLLLIAGSNDHIVPASLNKANFKRYQESDSVTELKEFPGRNHFGIGQKGWEELADYALEWAGRF
ncbi:MAG: alpha/beta hydrolase [Anaerolinea sp.]|nr:alpha/beta hydrolase [Anaerolinea sp.]